MVKILKELVNEIPLVVRQGRGTLLWRTRLVNKKVKVNMITTINKVKAIPCFMKVNKNY
jgi:hypothetical protein